MRVNMKPTCKTAAGKPTPCRSTADDMFSLPDYIHVPPRECVLMNANVQFAYLYLYLLFGTYTTCISTSFTLFTTMSLSKNNYKKIQDVQDDFTLKWELNTLNNVGSKHMELTRTTGGQAIIECSAFTTRFCNFQDPAAAGKFDSELSKHKFNAHFMEGKPPTLKLSDEQLDDLTSEQKETITKLRAIDDMCVRFMWNSPGVLEKKKKQCRAMLKKQAPASTSKDELEQMAYEMFADQAQSGLMLKDDNTYDIKTKMLAYRRVRGSSELQLRLPDLRHVDISGNLKQVNFDEVTINRGSLIVPHIKIKPYVTPNGAYGTTYTFIAGQLIVNGPSSGSSIEFSDHSRYTQITQGDEPQTKRQKL